jgi:acetyl-CoA carboxylase biotin carboxyl carrier protein
MSESAQPMEEPMIEAGAVADQPVAGPVAAEPVAVGPGDPVAPGSAGRAKGPVDGTDGSLLALVDSLAAILEKSDLGELEVTSGGTTIVLRAPSAIERTVAVVGGGSADAGQPMGTEPAAVPAAPEAQAMAAPAGPARPSVKAPLTGIYYGAPSPGATAYVAVGDHVSVGQIIGLIEAMKLFNEIKSDMAGRVVRICVENGALVKAKAPLIEVERA